MIRRRSRPGARNRFLARLGLRGQLALMSAAAVAISIAAVSLIAWTATRQSLYSQVDSALTGPGPSRGDATRRLPGSLDPEQLCTSADEREQVQAAVGTLQLVRSDGSTCSADSAALLPVTTADLAVAAGGASGGAPGRPRTVTRGDGVQVRVVTVPLGKGYAVLVSRDLTELGNTLTTLGLVLLVASGLGALVALLAGLAIARVGLRPIEQLTTSAERVAATTQLDEPIEIAGDDEVARLAKAFNTMLRVLTSARERQDRMVADASHELLTPLTSLRTNVELLLRSEDQGRRLPPADRRELLGSLAAQLEEFSKLTAELGLLAHGDPPGEGVAVRLDDVVRQAIARASLRGDHTVVTELEPWATNGDPQALERAVLNLIDNAVKFSPPGSTVRVHLRGGVLQVADEGPGIPLAERDQIFDRFWRSPSSRAMPGSGLGLAIVADVATGHGGAVWAGAAPAGGALLSLRLPGRVPDSGH